MTAKKYIEIDDKRKCSGCTACATTCPKKCISMVEDSEGFLYPVVDVATCIQCSSCIKVCPYSNSEFTNKLDEEELALCYAAYNKNEEIRYKSSSGGIFRVFADYVISEGGVVFGARFDKEFSVEHAYAETVDGVVSFMGSKYMQSRMGDSFSLVKKFADEGRKVLFTGCGCQIAGLKRYLKKDYDNLICVDLICHGVDSPMIWLDYLHSLFPDETVEYINFRDKITGQDNSSIYIKGCNTKFYDKKRNSIYFRSWRYRLFMRPSCEVCPFKKDNRVSDFTIGDCWGYQKMALEMYDDKGLSNLIVHTHRGKLFFEELASRLAFKPVSIDDVKQYNSDYIRNAPFNHDRRVAFWKDYHSRELPFNKLLKKHLEETRKRKLIKFIKKSIRKCLSLLKR